MLALTKTALFNARSALIKTFFYRVSSEASLYGMQKHSEPQDAVLSMGGFFLPENPQYYSLQASCSGIYRYLSTCQYNIGRKKNAM